MLLQAHSRTILERLWFIHSQRIDEYTQKEIRGSSCLLAIYKSKIMRGLFWIETIKRTGRPANIDYFFPWSKRHKICIISQELTNMSTILLCLLFLNKKNLPLQTRQQLWGTILNRNQKNRTRQYWLSFFPCSKCNKICMILQELTTMLTIIFCALSIQNSK